MSGNRKKNLRKITVDGNTYKWFANHSRCYAREGRCELKIWDDRCGVISDELVYGSVTPSFVAERIKELENER